MTDTHGAAPEDTDAIIAILAALTQRPEQGTAEPEAVEADASDAWTDIINTLLPS